MDEWNRNERCETGTTGLKVRRIQEVGVLLGQTLVE